MGHSVEEAHHNAQEHEHLPNHRVPDVDGPQLREAQPVEIPARSFPLVVADQMMVVLTETALGPYVAPATNY